MASDAADRALAVETITALADELEQRATESEADATDARRRASALRTVAADLTAPVDTPAPFGTRIAEEQQ